MRIHGGTLGKGNSGCGGRSPALRMAPVCITRQLATESAHTIRRITRDIMLPREKKRSAIRWPEGRVDAR